MSFRRIDYDSNDVYWEEGEGEEGEGEEGEEGEEEGELRRESIHLVDEGIPLRNPWITGMRGRDVTEGKTHLTEFGDGPYTEETVNGVIVYA
jgi:hypothetical protein